MAWWIHPDLCWAPGSIRQFDIDETCNASSTLKSALDNAGAFLCHFCHFAHFEAQCCEHGLSLRGGGFRGLLLASYMARSLAKVCIPNDPTITLFPLNLFAFVFRFALRHFGLRCVPTCSGASTPMGRLMPFVSCSFHARVRAKQEASRHEKPFLSCQVVLGAFGNISFSLPRWCLWRLVNSAYFLCADGVGGKTRDSETSLFASVETFGENSGQNSAQRHGRT